MIRGDCKTLLHALTFLAHAEKTETYRFHRIRDLEGPSLVAMSALLWQHFSLDPDSADVLNPKTWLRQLRPYP